MIRQIKLYEYEYNLIMRLLQEEQDRLKQTSESINNLYNKMFTSVETPNENDVSSSG